LRPNDDFSLFIYMVKIIIIITHSVVI
jgi:hypothetical protein